MAIVFGGVSFLLFLTAVYQAAYHSQGRAVVIGSIELVAMLFCLVGLAFGITGEFRKDTFHRTAHVGILVNLLVGIFHVVVLIQGY